MASYTKGFKTINVYTRGGDEFTATDAEKQPIASDALGEFLNGKVMHILNDPKNYIPLHAVDHIEVTNTARTVEKADAYCEPNTAIVCKSKVCESALGC